MAGEDENRQIAIIYRELERKGKLDKEGVAYAIGLTLSDWNLRQATALMKRVAEEYEDVDLKQGQKGKYILELKGWEELKKEIEKRIFSVYKFIKELDKITYIKRKEVIKTVKEYKDGKIISNGQKVEIIKNNVAEINEFRALETLFQLRYLSEDIAGWNSLSGDGLLLFYKYYDEFDISKGGILLIYSAYTDINTVFAELKGKAYPNAKYIIKIIVDIERREYLYKLKCIEKLKALQENAIKTQEKTIIFNKNEAITWEKE